MLSLLLAITLQTPSVLCIIDDARINESSGIAASPTYPGVFYTHNDSGDSARFFRFDKSGKVTGTFDLRGIQAIDWEDMAAAKIKGTSFLYFADVGENARVRKSVSIHRIREPKATDSGSTLGQVETYTLAYPDQARDCEAAFVRPNGEIWLVTKAREGETVAYSLPAPAKSGNYTLKKVGQLEVKTPGLGGNLITGADCSPDGKFIVLRTYSSVLRYEVPPKFNDWVTKQPQVWPWTIEKQGEAIAFTQDGKSIITTSEGTPFRVSIATLSNGKSSP